MTIMGKLLADAAALVGRKGEHAAGAGSLPGVDVSNWNGVPKDWKQAAGRISWAAVKSTEVALESGRLTAFANADAPADLAFLRQSGKGVIHYLFAHPDTPAQATGQMFAARVRDLGLRDDEGIAIDLEVSNGRSPGQVAAWTQEVAAYLERELERPVIIYSFLSFIQEGNCAGLGSRMLWMADPSSAPGHPRVPKPWKTWRFHQWSISGGLDRDLANFPDLAAMKAAIGRAGAATTLLEDPVLVLTGPGADTPVALPDGAKTVRLASVGDTTVNVEFAGAPVRKGIKLSWGHGQLLDVPKGAHSLRVYRPADGSPNVQVSVAVS